MLDKELPTLDNIIRELTESKFYGGITLKFESGKIVHCKKEESIKLQSLAEVYEKAVKDYSKMYLSPKQVAEIVEKL